MSNDVGFEKRFRNFADVNKVIEKIETACAEDDPFDVLMACIGIILLVNKPDITREQMEKGILQTSEWVALYTTTDLDGEIATKTPNNKVN